MKHAIRNYINQKSFKITIDNYIDIEDYTNIGNIDTNKIIIYGDNKKVTINGNNLSINKLTTNELLISGTYKNIIFEDNNE